MIHWTFPEDRPFNIIDKDGSWVACHLLAEDEETITVTYQDARTGSRMTIQMLREDIRAVSYHEAPIDVLERSLKEKR